MLSGMSERLVFDTHRFVRDLVSAGMAESIAETLAEKQVELLSGNLATKVELAQVEAISAKMAQSSLQHENALAVWGRSIEAAVVISSDLPDVAEHTQAVTDDAHFTASLICPMYGNLDNPILPPLAQKQELHIEAESVAL